MNRKVKNENGVRGWNENFSLRDPAFTRVITSKPYAIDKYLWDFRQSHGYKNEALSVYKSAVEDDLKDIDTKFLYMYAVTITPKGKSQRHSYYKKDFIKDLKTNRSFRFGWFYPESTNCNHYHGLVLCADKNVKFTVCRGRDRYVWMHEPVVDQKAWIKYICKPELTTKNANTLVSCQKSEKLRKKKT